MSAAQMFRFGSILLLLAAVGCKIPLREQTPIAAGPLKLNAGEWRVADQVVVITDGSGTMYMNQTFPEAKALTRSFVSSMPAADAPSATRRGYEAGLIGFGGDERKVAPLAPVDRVRLASTASELDIMGDISGLGGETPLHTVISESQLALQDKSGRAALVIFSDGVPDDPGRALESAKQLVEARNGNVCLHTVQAGSDPGGAAFMKQLSGLTGCGSYRAGSQISSESDVHLLARSVFLDRSELPAVGAGPCQGVMRLRGIEFGFDQADLTEASKPVLDVALEQLRECPEIRLRIGGHTDSIGTPEYNQGLSYRRAESTRDYFIQSGIDANRLEPEGFGESQPLAPNDTSDGRRQNRRVEIAPLN